MTAVDIAAIVAAAAAFQAGFVTPVVVAVWRLGTKVSEHTAAIDKMIRPALVEHRGALEDHDRRLHKLELSRETAR